VSIHLLGLLALLSAWIVFAAPALARPENAVMPGQFLVEPPTLICAGFEWKITGDDNRNAFVTVTFRKKGAVPWKAGLPLLRLGGERILDKSMGLDHTVPPMFAGSLFDLEPGTEYESRFILEDPDGVNGAAAKTVAFRTRLEPKPAAGGRIFHVYPPDYKGQKLEPAFTGLKEAYFGPGGADWSVVAPAKVQPGDVILVHAGLYKSQRYQYGGALDIPFHGTYVLTRSGTPDKPIVIKAAGDGEVIFDGDGCYRLFDVMAADYQYFEGFTIRNTEIAFYAGLKDVKGSSGLTVKNCRIEDVGIGVLTEYAGSRNFYIADNVMLGRHDTTRLAGWNGFWLKLGPPTTINSYYGVKVYGQGHVLCHNTVAYFHDGLDVCTHGMPDTNPALQAASIDIYNNDVFLTADDFIEADGGVHNIRVFRNRGINSAQHGLSAQPIYGGPAYFIRNIVYHVPGGGALKFNNNPAGLIVYHNTFCAEFGWSSGALYSNAHFRNNLFLGTDFPKRPILRTGTFTGYSTLDYDGFRPNQNAEVQFQWKCPDSGRLQDYTIGKQTPWQSFASLAEFSKGTGLEKNGRTVDYDVFEKVTKPNPDDPAHAYRREDLDFRLRAGGAAVDAGCALPNINDNFSGKAPDLGALELNEPLPIYGPRAR
jgi:hypothetical protein